MEFKLVLSFFIICIVKEISFGQTIGTFNSVAPGSQQQTFIFPSTHTFQRLIKSGDPLSLGGNLGNSLDFTGYVPIGGSSTNGYLSISSETTPAEVSILQISFDNGTGLWTINNGGKVSLNTNDIGEVSRFCSGAVTPNNTIIVSEEDVSSGNINPGVDSYTDRGWLIEIDPATRTVINQTGDNPTADKLWAIGRSNHENATIKSDNTVLYTGADDPGFGYLYKFIPTTPGDLSSGNLYVLQTTGALGNGTWLSIANTTVADRNNCRTLSQAAGAYNFNGIEDVEIGPDGKIYFAAKAEGKVYRFTDNGTIGTGADVSSLEVFAGNDSYPTITSYDVDGVGPLGNASWGTGNDNLAFDGDGNLWVLQDGGNNHIWVIAPGHTQASPQVRLFGKTPNGCEPTGITFSPDYKFMFLSFQHPSGSNTTSQTDAASSSVVFNTHTTIVVARSENLGAPVTLPVTFREFTANLNGNHVSLTLNVSQIINHSYFSIERSDDGVNFDEIGQDRKNINALSAYTLSFDDYNLPSSGTVYYRIKQVDLDNQFRYTSIRSVRVQAKTIIGSIYPQPVKDVLNFSFNSTKEGLANIFIYNINGNLIRRIDKQVRKGDQLMGIRTAGLANGIYTISVSISGKVEYRGKFIKQ